jgi:hypothetical protein
MTIVAFRDFANVPNKFKLLLIIGVWGLDWIRLASDRF